MQNNIVLYVHNLNKSIYFYLSKGFASTESSVHSHTPSTTLASTEWWQGCKGPLVLTLLQQTHIIPRTLTTPFPLGVDPDGHTWTTPDTLFTQTHYPHPFMFGEDVAQVFPDMVSRSVPGYSLICELLPSLLHTHFPLNNLVYDLGASLGAMTDTLLPFMGTQGKIIALDNSPSMTSRLRQKYAHIRHIKKEQIEIHQADVTAYTFEPCQLILCNLLLMFLPPTQRKPLITKCVEALSKNGQLVVIEKTQTHTFDPFTQAHQHYKQQKGYSNNEVMRKRESLNGVLQPLSIEEYEVLFTIPNSSFTRWFQAFQFIGWILTKH